MNQSQRFVTWLLCFFVLFGSSSMVMGSEYAELHIELTTPKAQIVSGEPVVLDFTITNPTDERQPFVQMDDLSIGGHNARLYVRRPGESGFQRFEPVVYAHSMPPPLWWLEPGDGYSHRSIICSYGGVQHGDDHLFIREPGSYEFKVAYNVVEFQQDDDGEVTTRVLYDGETDPLTIEVAPVSDGLVEAREQWEQIVRLSWGSPFEWDAMWAPQWDGFESMIQSMLAEYGDTVFGHYAKYSLALSQSAYERAGYENWIEYRQETLRAFAYAPTFPLADDALYHLAQTMVSDAVRSGERNPERLQHIKRERERFMDEYNERAPYSSLTRRHRPEW